MKRRLLTICVSLMILMGYAQQSAHGIEISLDPGTSENQELNTGIEVMPGIFVGISQATLTVYPAPKPNGMAILACPGGGYFCLSLDFEGRDMADWFNAQGITYAVLRYRMPNGQNNVPLSDAQQALRLMHEHAEEWGINPSRIGIMGCSAGGHLASTVATHWTDEETKPAFQVLFYPVISMDPEITHAESRKSLLGENPDIELQNRYCNEKQVTSQTPPAFIMACADDDVVPVQNSLLYAETLLKCGVSVSLHLWPQGGHGWGFKDSFSYKMQWQMELLKWLDKLYEN